MFVITIKATTPAVKANIFNFILIDLFRNHLRQFEFRPGQLVPCLICDADFVIYYRLMSKWHYEADCDNFLTSPSVSPFLLIYVCTE